MKTIRRITMLVLISSILTTFSCTKEGKQGETGPAGTNGINGNANVKSSTHTVYSWEWSSSNKITLFTPNVVQTIVDAGSVLVYIEGSSGEWAAIPLTAGSSSIIYSYKAYYVDIIASPKPTSTERFKVVAISASARLSNPHINFNDYYQVKGAFNLKD